MVTMQPPPAYSGDQAPPPPAYSGPAERRKNPGVYWGYWGVLFGTLLTWIFAVAAAADDAWLGGDGSNWDAAGLGEDCEDADFCGLYHAATAFQYMATIVVSIALVVVVVAAFMPAPTTGKLGIAVGIMLGVFTLFELIAFSTFAAFIEKYEDYWLYADFSPGPTLGVAVVAFLLGLAGTIVTFVLLRKATTEQDGPFRACMPNANAGGATAAAPPPAAGVAFPQPGAAPAGAKASQYPSVGSSAPAATVSSQYPAVGTV
ncbi:unnamed protein product [Ectocarpus fasciculatus]